MSPPVRRMPKPKPGLHLGNPLDASPSISYTHVYDFGTAQGAGMKAAVPVTAPGRWPIPCRRRCTEVGTGYRIFPGGTGGRGC